MNSNDIMPYLDHTCYRNESCLLDIYPYYYEYYPNYAQCNQPMSVSIYILETSQNILTNQTIEKGVVQVQVVFAKEHL